MKKLFLICALLICGSTFSVQAQWQDNIRRSLFSDQKAFNVGDAITIQIVEDTQADNSATTSQNADTKLSAGLTLGTGGASSNPQVGISSGNSFQGRGQTTRNERIRAQLSARVIAVEPNGNMKIEGKRTTKINGENQSITITGIVRPVDIQPDNSVRSYNISNLELVYEGDGTVTKSQEPGLLTKFIRMLF